MIKNRILETVAMAIIGDGLLCLVSPRRHLSLWMSGPRWWQRTWKSFVRFPGLTRTLGMFGIGFGIWLAWKQEPQIPRTRDRHDSLPHRWSEILAEAAQ